MRGPRRERLQILQARCPPRYRRSDHGGAESPHQRYGGARIALRAFAPRQPPSVGCNPPHRRQRLRPACVPAVALPSPGDLSGHVYEPSPPGRTIQLCILELVGPAAYDMRLLTLVGSHFFVLVPLSGAVFRSAIFLPSASRSSSELFTSR